MSGLKQLDKSEKNPGGSGPPSKLQEDRIMKQNTARKNESFGTREWATHTVNCCTGCAHDCRYCYAKSMAIRFRRVFPDVWKDEQVRWKDVNRRYRKMDGTVMFPPSHDITDALWIGKMNDIRRRVDIEDRRTQEEVRRIEAGQTDERILEIYKRHRDNPLIKWKESIKKVVHLPIADRPGADA
jgi:hypothetical protein